MFNSKILIIKWAYLAIALFVTLSFSANAISEGTLNAQFKKAYYSYQYAVKNKDTDAQFIYAKEAYQLGIKFYGDTNINTANLALILAKQHLNKKEQKQATPLLLDTISIFKSEYGKDALVLAEIYMLLAHNISADNQGKKSKAYYLKALDIAEEHEEEHPYFNAEIQLEAGISLLKIKSKKSKVILTAQTFFNEHLTKDDVRVINANFYAGKYNFMRKRYKTAIEDWQANVAIFESLEGATHPLALNTHAFLIHALEKSGKSDEATKHCIAIGSMTPWDDNQRPKPLFRIEPKYPLDKARKSQEGYAVIGFTLSDFGTVIGTEVLESSGGKSFEKSSLAALKKWRYAPKFEEGRPVETYTTVRLDFKMEK